MLRNYSQKELRELVKMKIAKDLSTCNHSDISEFIKTHHIEKIGISSGTYGINGGVIQDVESGELYVIIGRNVALLTVF